MFENVIDVVSGGFWEGGLQYKVAKEASDLITNQLVSSAVASAIALTPIERKEWPIADFDMKYFVEVMLNLFGERNDKHLRAILRGEDVRWWGDEDSEG